MPRRTPDALVWHARLHTYELLHEGRAVTPAVRPETAAWWAWLDGASSFAFLGASGAGCTVRKEARRRLLVGLPARGLPDG